MAHVGVNYGATNEMRKSDYVCGNVCTTILFPKQECYERPIDV